MVAVLEKETKAPSIKAKISRVHLQKALKLVERAIPGASCVIPILRSIKLEQDSDGLAIQATDLEASVRALIPETTQLSTPLVVSSERFVPWVQLLDGDQVSLTANAARVTVQCGQPKVFVPRLNANNFPQVSFTSLGDGFEMMQSDLLRMLKHTIIAIGDEERFTLNGVLLEADGTTLYAVAMDGHRMAVYSRPIDKTFRYLIPERMLRLLLPVIVEGKESVHIQEDELGFLASVSADIPVFVHCRKPNGTFPNWQAVMPASHEATLTVDSMALLSSLVRCLLMGDQKTHTVAVEFASEGINLHAVDALAGEAEESIPATGGPTESVTIGINGTYLSQALKQIGGSVRVQLPKEVDRPIIFRSEPAPGEVFNYIVMPMRLNR